MTYVLPPTYVSDQPRVIAGPAVTIDVPGVHLFRGLIQHAGVTATSHVLCYAPAEFRIAEGNDTFFAWIRRQHSNFEFEATLLSQLSGRLQQAIEAKTTPLPDGTIEPLLPCDLSVKWVRPLTPEVGISLPTTISVTSVGSYPIVHIRISGAGQWERYFNSALASPTGVLFQVGYVLTGQSNVQTANLIIAVGGGQWRQAAF